MKEIRRRVVVFEAELSDAYSQEVLAHGQITYVCIDPKEGRSKDIPKVLISLLRGI